MTTPDQLEHRKERMLAYAHGHDIDVPSGFNAKVGVFGGSAARLLKAIQQHLGLKPTGVWSAAVQSALFPTDPHVILHAYHADHTSGTRPLSAVWWYVLHDMENTNHTKAAEETGAFFERGSSTGSTHFGVDNDSIQQYLPLGAVPWGAPYANSNGVHIEQMGSAAWSRDQWMSLAGGTLTNTAWLLADLHSRPELAHVPLRPLSDDQVRRHAMGIVTHRQISRVFGGTHTDPGSDYPLQYVVERSQGRKRS